MENAVRERKHGQVENKDRILADWVIEEIEIIERGYNSISVVDVKDVAPLILSLGIVLNGIWAKLGRSKIFTV
jgi:hypothetical protein